MSEWRQIVFVFASKNADNFFKIELNSNLKGLGLVVKSLSKKNDFLAH